MLVGLSGCSGIQECLDEHCNSMHTELTGMEAWARWSWCYNELTHPKDFACGFRAGYLDVVNGGVGCQPTLPPKQYWKACYRNAEGHCRVNQWFEGFSHGAVAAEQDGANVYGHIPMSPTAQANFATMTQPAPVYDWSGSQAPPAPMASPAPVGTQNYQPLPSAQPAVPDPTPTDDDDPLTPDKPYEDDAEPILEKALETTSGRVTLPNLGG